MYYMDTDNCILTTDGYIVDQPSLSILSPRRISSFPLGPSCGDSRLSRLLKTRTNTGISPGDTAKTRKSDKQITEDNVFQLQGIKKLGKEHEAVHCEKDRIEW